jgi:hypothetical protein
MIAIKTSDGKLVDVDKELFVKFTEKGKEEKQLDLNINPEHIKYAVEYMTHHAAKETQPPPPPVTLTSTIDDVLDKWDATFLKRIVVEEKDPMLVEFSRSVETLNMATLLKKVSLVITINITQSVGTDASKLAEAFNKFALRAK